jgi:hypothetical protein
MLKTKIFFYLGVLLLILFLIAILLPAVQRPTKCYRYYGSMGNLKCIGLALCTYAEDHNDVLPDNFKQIDFYLGPESKYILNSPLKPRDINVPSYIYISGHSFKDVKANSQGKYIIVYENPEYLTGYDFQKIIVTYLDGSVDRLKKEDFLSKLKATYEHLGKPMPEIKFKEQVPANVAR